MTHKTIRRHKLAYSVQVSGSMKHGAIEKILAEQSAKEQQRLLRVQSMRGIQWTVRSGYLADGIIKNMTTYVFTSWGFKVPRIIKNMLHASYKCDRKKRKSQSNSGIDNKFCPGLANTDGKSLP